MEEAEEHRPGAKNRPAKRPLRLQNKKTTRNTSQLDRYSPSLNRKTIPGISSREQLLDIKSINPSRNVRSFTGMTPCTRLTDRISLARRPTAEWSWCQNTWTIRTEPGARR